MIKSINNVLERILPERAPELSRAIRNPDNYIIGQLTYNQDWLATCHNCDFMKDELFMQSYNLGANKYINFGTVIYTGNGVKIGKGI